MSTRHFISVAAFVLGLAVSASALEAVLRFLPVCKGNYAAEPDAAWPAHHLIPDSHYTFSTGWEMQDVRRGRVNNLGYVAPFDFRGGTRGVFVVGDSFIESQMNDYAESIQGRLPALLDHPLPVLGFGTSGGTLPHDLGVASLIGARFSPTWAVVLITRGNFTGGFAAKPGYYRWSVPQPGVVLVPERRHGRVGEFFRDLSLVAYARSNLRADLSTLFSDKSRGAESQCRAASLSESDRALIELAVRELPTRFGLPPSRIILLFDADRAAIYAGNSAARPCPPRDALADRLLAARAAQTGITVIDMEPLFRNEFERNGTRFDYLPVDGHWNAAGHALAARAVAAAINGATAAPAP